jgi:hypothetical protein
LRIQSKEIGHVENNNGGSKLLGRRRTLQLLGVGLTATGLFGLEACSKGGGAGPTADPKPADEPKAAALDCNSTIDEASKTQRRTLQYKKEAADPAKKCINCAQFDAKKYGDCGGCKLFTGPVQPNGGCLSFAPKGAAEAGAAKPT